MRSTMLAMILSLTVYASDGDADAPVRWSASSTTEWIRPGDDSALARQTLSLDALVRRGTLSGGLGVDLSGERSSVPDTLRFEATPRLSAAWSAGAFKARTWGWWLLSDGDRDGGTGARLQAIWQPGEISRLWFAPSSRWGWTAGWVHRMELGAGWVPDWGSADVRLGAEWRRMYWETAGGYDSGYVPAATLGLGLTKDWTSWSTGPDLYASTWYRSMDSDASSGKPRKGSSAMSGSSADLEAGWTVEWMPGPAWTLSARIADGWSWSPSSRMSGDRRGSKATGMTALEESGILLSLSVEWTR